MKNLHFENGEILQKQGQHLKAYEEYLSAGNEGCSEALVAMAFMIIERKVTPYDEIKITSLFKQAAELGNRKAAFNLAISYKEGFGIEKDIKEAIKYFRIAADKGNERAMVNLALLYDGAEYEDVEADVSNCLHYLNMYFDLKPDETGFFTGQVTAALNKSIAKKLLSKGVKGRIYNYESEAHCAAIMEAHKKRTGFCDVLETYKDIAYMPISDDLNNYYGIDYINRRSVADTKLRQIPCFIVRHNGDVLAIYGFYESDEAGQFSVY